MKEDILSKISEDHMFEWNGHSKTLAEWSSTLGINLKTLYGRLEEGWSIDKSFSTPVKKRLTRLLTLPDGEKVAPAVLADRLQIPRSTLYSQIERGWSIEKIIEHQQEKPITPCSKVPRLLTLQYERLVKILGEMDRNGESPSDAWFAVLDACLDRIWELKDRLEDPEEIEEFSEFPPEDIKPSRQKDKPLTMEEANRLRELQHGRKMMINPNFDADKKRNRPDVDNRS